MRFKNCLKEDPRKMRETKSSPPTEIRGQGGSMFYRIESALCGFRKFLLLSAGVLALAVISAGQAQAAQSANAYIVLKCTVTMSVSLVAPTSWYNFGEVLAADTYYSNTPIVVRNDSQGAICRWDLNIDAASLNGWTLASQPGLDQLALSGICRKTNQPTPAMFQTTNSSFSVTAREYNALNFYDADYESDGYQSDSSKVLPKTYADTVGKSADRKIWLKLMTPLLVSDQVERTLQLVVTAKMAS